MTLDEAIVRRPALRFLMGFDARGGTTPGSIGLPHDACKALDQAGLAKFDLMRPVNYRVTIPRRYMRLMRGEHTAAFAAILRDELRNHNLPAILGLDDGVGRASFRTACRERPEVVRRAALAALARWRAQ